MKNLDLNFINVQEMDILEMKSIEGGRRIPWKEIVGGFVAAYDAVTDFIDGFKEGWNDAAKK